MTAPCGLKPAPQVLPPVGFDVTGVEDRRTWDPTMATLIAWFQRSRSSLPLEPFELDPGVVVREPEELYYTIEEGISEGPLGFAAAFGGLRDDLEALFAAFGV
jgi:hypothetical protein